ncbi:LysM peptidoglycan-binding domain-containing protein, partial [Ideonella sp. 4Y11]
MKNTTTTSAGTALSSLAIAAWLALSAPAAEALGLGRLSVRSALGEPLRAEIDISSITPEEADTLKAVLASPESFRSAGVEMNPALQGVQVTLVRGADGRPVLRMAGDRAVSEPFLDVILDLSWASGRLQRSYTLLIDPPIKPAPAPAPQTAPVMSNAPAQAPVARPVRPQPAPSAEPVAPTAASAPAARPPAPTPPSTPAAPAAPAQGYRVKSGDTLSSIANANARPGVSLDQMLVALYRGNPDAFIGSNMNRLKAGVVLDVAEAQARAGDIPAAEARRVFQAQSADFAAFRQRLAGAAPVVKSAEPPRQAQGKVEAAVKDRKTDGAPTPDQLKLSKGGLKAASAPEAKISKDTERKAAEARMSELTRNVEELKRLSSASAVGGKAASAPGVPPVAVTKPVAPPPPPPPPPALAASVAPPAVVASAPASAALPASAPAAVAS